MCGVFGFVNNKIDERTAENNLKKMSKALAHRGPDNEGFFSDGKEGIYLGHRRLSIIDLSEEANQPMSDESESVYLSFNGEIYNFRELRKTLKDKGYRFRSQSDTEVVLNSYKEWGTDCFRRFRGIFAFVLFNKKKNKLILVRDHFGVKPLYYAVKNGGIIFASEVKAFKALGQDAFPLKINFPNLELLLGFQYLPLNDRTILDGILKVPPAHYLIFENGKTELTRYWKLEQSDVYCNLSFEDAKTNLEKILQDVVKMQMVADVPVGVMLSGGLDSSVIAALAKKSSNGVHTFTAGFDHKIDERGYARIVAQHLGTIHEEIILDPREMSENIEKSISHFDDLNTFDAGLITNSVIAEKLKEWGIKVILLGEGADEIFGGYSWFGLSKLPFSFLPEKAKRFLYYYSVSRNMNFSSKRHFKFANELFQKINKKDEDFFQKISRFEIEYQLPNNYLMKVDKGTMAHSIEARVPFLDFRLVELVFSLPTEFKLRGRFHSFSKVQEKYILRKVAEKYLPPQIAQRKKKGGMFPVSEFIKSNGEKIKERLLDKNSLSIEIFGRKKIEDLFAGGLDKIGTGNFKFREVEREIFLWKFYLLEVWSKNFFK